MKFYLCLTFHRKKHIFAPRIINKNAKFIIILGQKFKVLQMKLKTSDVSQKNFNANFNENLSLNQSYFDRFDI